MSFQSGIQEKEWCHESSPYNVIPVLDTGIQSLLCSHLFKVKFSGSQCLGTGMTP
uniref:hypothetical protein n=1 Tax=Wolbachia pipientis TaxID=955 RepID=UPI00397BF37F